MHELRMVSFAAEQFWKFAFTLALGLNSASASNLQSVLLSDVRVNGKWYEEAEVLVPEKDAELALRVAIGVVNLLEGEKFRYRILGAVVRAGGGGGEHDLVAERKGKPGRSSIEVKCKRVKKEERLYDTFRQQMRKDALKAWRPAEFKDRVVVLVQFPGVGSLAQGWTCMRCESYDASGSWKALYNWDNQQPAASSASGSRSATEQTPKMTAGEGGAKHSKRAAEAPSGPSKKSRAIQGSGASSSKSRQDIWVLIDGEKYTALPWFIGKTPVKSQRSLAERCCSDRQVDLRRGDCKSISKHMGQEILAKATLKTFRDFKWADTVCTNAEGTCLQVKLLRQDQKPSSSAFLWNVKELENCRALLVS